MVSTGSQPQQLDVITIAYRTSSPVYDLLSRRADTTLLFRLSANDRPCRPSFYSRTLYDSEPRSVRPSASSSITILRVSFL